MISAQSKPVGKTIANHRRTYTKEIEVSRHKPIYTLALASILAGVLAGCADFRPSGTQSAVPDAQITANAEAQLDQMTDLGPPGSIRVQTFANVVYLNGVVNGGLAKRNAEGVIRQVPGVQQVVDDIYVAHK
jgi:osmotically-inducible protein OsmY